MSYIYQPLDDPWHQIRLLTIFPNRDRSSVIEAKLSTHTLPASIAPCLTRFRAYLRIPMVLRLILRMGKGAALEKTHEIILDGCRYPVTATVQTALLQYRSLASWPLNLWINSILSLKWTPSCSK